MCKYFQHAKPPQRLPTASVLSIKIILIIASTLIGGCVAVPYHSYKVYEGREITTDSLAWITPGVTTRMQIIERLGQPDISFKEQNIIAYEWSGQYGRVAILAYGGGSGSTPIKMRCAMVMEFGVNDEVKDYSIIARPSAIIPYDYRPNSEAQLDDDDWRRIIRDWREASNGDQKHNVSGNNGCYSKHEYIPQQ